MKTRNLLRTAAILAAFSGLGIASAQTLLNNASVEVSVTLASKCRWQSSAPTGLAADFGTYTAFQATAKTATAQTFTVECTRGFGAAPTITWDGGSASGVLNGLQYTLSVTGGTPTAGTPASTSTIGTGDQIVYTLGGTMPALQAGTDGTSTPATRQLTMTF